MDFYKIETKETITQVLRQHDNLVTLVLDNSKVVQIFQHQEAVIVEKKTGYDIYLPIKEYSLTKHDFVTGSFLSKVITNTSSFLPYNALMLFKDSSERHWKILHLHNFMLAMSEEHPAKLLPMLPRIPCEKDSTAYFREDFDYTERDDFPYTDRIICNIDSKDFLIVSQYQEIPSSSPNIKVSCIGKAELLSHTSKYFKATNEIGNEFWYETFWCQDGPFSKIEELKPDDYPSEYPADDFTGYYLKKNGLIVGLKFLSNSNDREFPLYLPFPVRKLQFMFAKNATRNDKDKKELFLKTEFWHLISDDEDCIMVLSKASKHYILINKKDLFA